MIYDLHLELRLSDNPEHVREVVIASVLDHQASVIFAAIVENFPPDLLASICAMPAKDEQ